MVTNQSQVVLVSYFNIFLLTGVLLLLSHEKTEARNTEMRNMLGAKPEGTIKTIKAEHGDIIDCVDIYKQPALKHPLIKEIQMTPGSYPKGFEINEFDSVIFQDWHRFGRCPQETIPIRRTDPSYKYHPHWPAPTTSSKKEFDPADGATPIVPEYATVEAFDEPYFGAQVTMDIWNPAVEIVKEYSMAKLSIASNSINDLGTSADTVAAGWTVDPARYGDKQTRFFIYYTSDNSLSGCYNHECQGFVQTNWNFALGSVITPTSEAVTEDIIMTITIHRDTKDKNWWLQMNGTRIGYWPGSTFTGLAEGASSVTWGGEILNLRYRGYHTSTEMGSGYPTGGVFRAALMRNLKVIDSSDTMKDPANINPFISNSSCYDLFVNPGKDDYGTSFYYGGAGGSQQCLY